MIKNLNSLSFKVETFRLQQLSSFLASYRGGGDSEAGCVCNVSTYKWIMELGNDLCVAFLETPEIEKG